MSDNIHWWQSKQQNKIGPKVESCRTPHFPIKSGKSFFKIIKSFRNLKYCWSETAVGDVQVVFFTGPSPVWVKVVPAVLIPLVLLAAAVAVFMSLVYKRMKKTAGSVCACACLCVADLACSCGDVESFSLKSDETYWY